jgi:hypothetical protein
MTMPVGVTLLGVLALVMVLGFVADRLSALLHLDRGVFWTRATGYWIACAVLVLFGSWLIELVDAGWWQSGRHAFIDVTGSTAVSPVLGWHLALWMALAVWLLILLIALFPLDTKSASARWLAGAIGMSGRRTWLLLLPLPSLLLLLAVVSVGVAPGVPGYPVVPWVALLVAAVSLVGVALSRDQRPGMRPTPRRAVRERHYPDWPTAMRGQGFGLRTLGEYPPATGERGLESAAGRDLVNREPRLKRECIAPELIDAVATLVEGASPADAPVWGAAETDARPANRLVLAPEDCGQLELTALAADLIRQRFQAVTLVIAPRDAEQLGRRLGAWLDQPSAVDVLRRGAGADPRGFIWITVAEHLSDRVIKELEEDPMRLNRIGLVVWWDLHEYSGVLAANFWAISHRFQRLIDLRGRSALRHLAFVTGSSLPDSDLRRFISQSLPQAFPAEAQVVVPPRSRHRLALHLIDSVESGHGARHAPGAPPLTDLVLGAARASVRIGWPTSLEVPAHVDADEAAAFLQQTEDGRPLSARICQQHTAAGAHLLEVGSGDVLQLLLRICQGGRALTTPDVHHVGVVAGFGNPYVRWLLEQLAERSPEALYHRSRRLVPGRPQPAVIQRHLLLALHELPAVTSGLLETFQWEATEIDRTLRELAAKGRVSRSDVRYLDEAGDLKPEIEYTSTNVRDRPRPLDTVGAELVPVIDPAAGDRGALLMALDPERLTIAAYPSRVFTQQGRRYRVEHWTSVQDVVLTGQTGGIRCVREDLPCLTWRLFEPRVRNLAAESRSPSVSFGRLPFARSVVTLEYEEDVRGYLEYARDVHSGAWEQRNGGSFETIRSQAFRTRALLLEIDRDRLLDFPLGLPSLAQALRMVFPVHIGVDDDAVAVVAAEGIELQGRNIRGLLFVDLFPRGIGLVDDIKDDSRLLVRMFEQARAWLHACVCDRHGGNARDGCPQCMRSPLAMSASANPAAPPSRDVALGILDAVLGLDRS